MLIPNKHIDMQKSLLGFGAYLLTKFNKHTTVDELWHQYQKDFDDHKYFAKHSFDNLVLALIFLNSIGLIEQENGDVVKCV